MIRKIGGVALNKGSLDEIIQQVLMSVNNGRWQVEEFNKLIKNEFKVVSIFDNKLQKNMVEIQKALEEKEVEEKQARRFLAEVSSDIEALSEEKLQQAYAQVSDLQEQVEVLRTQALDLSKQIKSNKQKQLAYINKIKKAANLAHHLQEVTNYLGNQMLEMIGEIKDLRYRQLQSEYIIYGQEEERLRLARDIHDGPAQSIAGISFKAEFCKKLIDQDPIRCKQELNLLTEMVRDTLGDVRNIIFDLRPMSIDDLGLTPTLKNYIEKIKKENAIDLQLKITGRVVRLASHLEVGIYRIVQEAMSNVLRHAKANYACIEVTYTNEQIWVRIIDNGEGFDVDKVSNGHYGLIGMRERAKLFTGDLEINSTPGRGTTIRLVINTENYILKVATSGD